MGDKAYLDTKFTRGATAAAWEDYGLWLADWRARHPRDGRSDLQLVGEFAREPLPPPTFDHEEG